MSGEKMNPIEKVEFDDELAPLASLLMNRSYARFTDGKRESNEDVFLGRTIEGLRKLGNLTEEEVDIIRHYQGQLKVLTSGRGLFVQGTEAAEKIENVYSHYNCSNINIESWYHFGLLMNMAMQGTGTGAKLEPMHINKLPVIINKINVEIKDSVGTVAHKDRLEETDIKLISNELGQVEVVEIYVGDSRKGWIQAYENFLILSTNEDLSREVNVHVYLGNVRPKDLPLKGFGGVSNPTALPFLFSKCAAVLNKAIGRKLNSVECCKLIDEAAAVVVAGSIRRSAGMRQGASDDEVFTVAKDNLWIQDFEGNWNIDPERDALRMANHSRVFKHKPTFQECLIAVTKQYYSGEGAIQWAGEAVARSNADLIVTKELKQEFLIKYASSQQEAIDFLYTLNPYMDEKELQHRMGRYGLNPCGEIVGDTLLCNLGEVHLNLFDPLDVEDQKGAFEVAGLMVAVLLNHKFPDEIMQYSRDLDPIVGVSFTGLFDFFVKAMGVQWLQWWQSNRDKSYNGALFKEVIAISKVLNINTEDYKKEGELFKLGQLFYDIEKAYFNVWKKEAFKGVYKYCDERSLKRPSRCTDTQPSGSKSLLTGASSGWHPPKAGWFIRRMTFRREDPIALAAIDYGYNVVPSQSAKDEKGNLLNDPFDPRVDEWLIEVPTRTIWADTPGVEDIDINKFSAISQLDFYMNVQREYTTHNCFSRDTKFLTSEGIKSFEDYEVGDKVTVLNREGEWSEATVVNTGDTRPMLKINLDRVVFIKDLGHIPQGKSVELISTHCHRFPVRDFHAINNRPKIMTADELSKSNGTYHLLTQESYLDASNNSSLWLVNYVEEVEPQVGWCVMEPKTNHFTLENNILVMNTSGTVEFIESEIEDVAKYIYDAIQNDNGYISTALLQRLSSSFPRLPFEPIDKETYIKLREDVLAKRKSENFYDLLQFYTKLSGMMCSSPQDSACEGIICELGGLPPGGKKG